VKKCASIGRFDPRETLNPKKDKSKNILPCPNQQRIMTKKRQIKFGVFPF
jgi:hypothetical protein